MTLPKAKSLSKKIGKKSIKKVILTSKEQIIKELTPKQKSFCREYVIDWNGTRAYRVAYPNTKNDNVAAVNANRLLRKAKIQKYCEEIQKDLDKLCGISKAMIINEHKKLAFSSIARLHNTWIERKDFEELTEDQKACISEISTKVEGVFDEETKNVKQVQFVKIKLFDKQKSLDSITKLCGFEAPAKTELTGKDGKPLIPPARVLTKEEARELLNKLENDC